MQRVIDDLGFVAFVWGEERDAMGWARPACAGAMCEAGILRPPGGPFAMYRMQERCVDGSPAGSRLQHLAVQWHQAGLLPAWRNELFDIYSPGHHAPRFALERVAARHLGLWTEAVHMNVVLRDGTAMWLARRAAHKDTDPGMLDNLVAGGVAQGESAWQTLQRESWEEAGIRLDIVANAGEGIVRDAAATGETAQRLHPAPKPLRSIQILALEGSATQPYLRRERLYAFELEVDARFTPVNKDGEVSDHVLLSRAELEVAIAKGLLTKDAERVARLWRAGSGREAGQGIDRGSDQRVPRESGQAVDQGFVQGSSPGPQRGTHP